MKTFGVRFIYGKSLDKLVKENNIYIDKYKRDDFYYKFFTNKERSIISCVYMTVYQNSDGKQYVLFTNNLPQPSGKFYTKIENIIGAKTLYNTEVVSCEKCYIIG